MVPRRFSKQNSLQLTKISLIHDNDQVPHSSFLLICWYRVVEPASSILNFLMLAITHLYSTTFQATSPEVLPRFFKHTSNTFNTGRCPGRLSRDPTPSSNYCRKYCGKYQESRWICTYCGLRWFEMWQTHFEGKNENCGSTKCFKMKSTGSGKLQDLSGSLELAFSRYATRLCNPPFLGGKIIELGNFVSISTRVSEILEIQNDSLFSLMVASGVPSPTI